MKHLIFLLPLAGSAQVLNITVLDYASVPVAWMIETGRPGESTRLADVPGDIVLRICTKEMAKGLVRKASILGYVQPTAEGELPRVANVFYHRIEDLTGDTGSSAGVVLGTAMAHEAGHLLLGKGAHSLAGIMRCPWDREELRWLQKGQLTFDIPQSVSIVAGIAMRDRKVASKR